MKTLKTIALISIVSVGMVSSVLASIDKNLKYGQRDKEVLELQEFLTGKGLLKTIASTYFGLSTFRAVKAYQTSIGLSPTGFVGALTREKINKEIDIKLVTPNQVGVDLLKNTSTNSLSTSTSSALDSNNATNSSTYGVGFIMPDGTKILSPLRVYGFYKETVEAEKNGEKGTYNQTTKVFESYSEKMKKDDEYQKSIVLKNTITPPSRPELPAFEIADNVIAGDGNGGTARDTLGAWHTVVCAYANGDLGIQSSEVTNWIKQKLDSSTIYTTYGVYPPAINLTKELRPTAFDETGMIYSKKVRACGVITNKNGQLDYLYRYFNTGF